VKDAVANLISRSLRNVRADLGANIGTVLAVGVAVLIPLVFGLLALNLGRMVNSFVGNVEVVAYISIDAQPPQIEQTVGAIRAMPEVGTVTLVTSEMALARFSEELPEVADVVRELGDNPLPPSLEIVLNTGYRDLPSLEDFVGRVARLPGVVEVDDGRQWIERLSRFIKYMWAITIIMGLFLAMAAGLLVANTIRLAIYRRREEIGIYRLVGATNAFIRGPLLAEGILQGVAGSLIALTACYGLYRYAVHRLQTGDLIRDWLLGGLQPVWPTWPITLTVIALGGLIGLVAAHLSSRRFLKV
jgi:cell division transport system permease protein